MTLKLISWNVNGLRACIQKGFLEQFQKLDADFFCLQETKLQEGQLTLDLPGYEQYWCYAEKKGYSGTAIFTKHTPISVSYGLGVPELDNEGRVITLEYPEFYLVNCYTPNAQRGLARLAHRMKWDEAYRDYVASLDAKKPTILCGDLNVAHKEIDLKNPASNRGNAGFSDEERESFSKTLSLGFTDTFRYLNPTTTGAYSWWSYMYHARENNAGWRIDYFLVSDRLRDQVYSTPIYSDILGSDHCPVGLELDVSCNGSVWMEESKGKPRAILPEKKGPKLAAKVLLAAVALIILTGLGGYAARLFPSPFDSYLTLYQYTEPLLHYGFAVNSYYTGTLSDGIDEWQLCGPNVLFPRSYTSNTTKNTANFWLRLELTEKALETFNEDWVLSLSCDRELYIGYWDNLGSPSLSSTVSNYDLVVHAYYLDENSSEIGGWFIYGVLPGETKLHITLDTGSEQVKTTHTAVPLTVGPDTSDAEKLVTETLVYKIVTDKIIQLHLSLSSVISSSDAIYHNMKAISGDVVELETRDDAVACLLERMKTGEQKERMVAYTILSQGVYQNKMTSIEESSYQELSEYLFTLTAEESKILSTDDLLGHLAELSWFINEIEYSSKPNTCEILATNFPALAELISREDAVQVFMNQSGGSKQLTAYFLLRHSEFRDKMTVEEKVLYLTGEYKSNIVTGNTVFLAPELTKPAEECTTEELVNGYLLKSGLGELLLRARSGELCHGIYAHYEEKYPDMKVLRQRVDIADTLFAMLEKEKEFGMEHESLKAMMRLDFVQSRMTNEQKALYDEKYDEQYMFFMDVIRAPAA